MRSGRAIGCLVATLAALAAAAPAHATFPGPNGTIAYSSNRGGAYDIWAMNPDGTNQRPVTSDAATDSVPAWAPGRREIAFTRDLRLYVMDATGGGLRRVFPADYPVGYGPAWSPDGGTIAFSDFAIYVVDADGNGEPREISQVNAPEKHYGSDWAPDGQTIAFSRNAQGGDRYGCWAYGILSLVDPAGTNERYLGYDSNWLDSDPSFSPDGEKLVFERRPNGSPECGSPPGLADLYAIPVDGGAPARLTNTPAVAEVAPVWSPDGTKIAFSAIVDGNRDIYVMNADGTDRRRLTTDPADDDAPSWGGALIPLPSVPRPKSARAIRVPLVPAYAECTAPNRTHGPPLAFGSCSPPAQSSDVATFGTPDSNGYPANSTGYLRLSAQAGNPSTAEDEADVRLRFELTDVRRRGNLTADYQWYVSLRLPFQLTDAPRNEEPGCCGTPSTLQSAIPLYADAPCTATPDPSVGGSCALTTTTEAYVPGLVREGDRAMWQMLGPVQVFDTGPDGSAGDSHPLATQGLFVP